MKKRRRDLGPSETDMQFKTISLLAERLGSSNVFAREESSVDTVQPLNESEYFPDIMQIKEGMSFHDSKVKPRQNLHSVPAIYSKDLAHESRHSLKSRLSRINSTNESKLTPTSKLRPGASLVSKSLTVESSGFHTKARDTHLSATPSARIELHVKAKQVFGDYSPISQAGSQKSSSKE
jgi:hypothetical protein